MPLFKKILRFLGIFAVVYIIMLAPANLGNSYAEFHRNTGDWLFGDFREKGLVDFKPNDLDNNWEARTVIWLMNKDQVAAAQQGDGKLAATYVHSNWYTDYLLIAIFLSLIIATPIPIKRKLWAMLFGLIFLHLYIYFCVYIQILYQYNQYEYLQVLTLSPFWEKIVNFLQPLLSLNPGTGIFVALLTWMAVAFNRTDFQKVKAAISKKI